VKQGENLTMQNRHIDNELVFKNEFPIAMKFIMEEAINNNIELSDYYFSYCDIGTDWFSVTYFLDGAEDNSFYLEFSIDKDRNIECIETSINGE